jgi:hypothetical protein
MNTASLSDPAPAGRARRRSRLASTLFLAIAVKCLVLFGLWHAFFSHPQTKHMLLPSAQVERHLFDMPAHGAPLSHPSN